MEPKLREHILEIVSVALAEDLGNEGDITSVSVVPPEARSAGVIVSRASGKVAGLAVAEEVFRQVDGSIVFEKMVEEGQSVSPGKAVSRLSGSTSGILAAERTALNFLQHLSGIASLTASYVEKVRGLPVAIMDTRKTLPGLRALQKYAVRIGGGLNHRLGLYDAVLIKDNHIKSVGGVRKVLEKARAGLPSGTPVEIEVENLEELSEALELGAETIMLDNWPLSELKGAVKVVARRAKLEASGGVTLETVKDIAATGVDFISVGELTHSAPALDFSLELEWNSQSLSRKR